MNADLKRVRDSSMDDGPSPHHKKRAFMAGASPPVEAGDDDKQDWMEVVETKRKEAIYRQMLEYRRSYEEESRRADAVEAQKRVLEASIQAVEICWNQVLSTIQDMMGSQDVASDPSERRSLPAAGLMLAPLEQLSTPELENALNARLPQTQSLLTRFMSASSSGTTYTTADLQRQVVRLQGDIAASRSGQKSLQAQISTLTDSRDNLQRDYQRAQKALDRQRMEHDKAEASWRDLAKAPREATPKPNGSGHATPNGIKEEAKPVLNGPTAAMLPDTSEVERVADARQKEIQQLVLEQTKLKQENDRMRIVLDSPSEAALRASPWFSIYLNQLSTQIARANDLQARLEKSEGSLDRVRDGNGTFRDTVVAEESKKCEALQAQLAKQNSELARIRGQRDDLTAELSERKLKDTDKMKYGEQMEMLANTREGRITYLQSEVMRLKGQLGAEHGSKGYLAFLHSEGIDADYVKDLERRLRDQEIDGDKSCEADLRREVEKYERIVGDATDLAARLDEVTSAKESLELKLQEAQGSTDALYSEVEGLSKLWEDLQRETTAKVFSHKDAELRIQRAVTEKAKADNKYFLAMREKEALDAENKNLQRVLDKQGKFVDAAKETEVALKAQLAAQEKALSSMKNEAQHLQTSLATASAEKHGLETKLSMATGHLSTAQDLLKLRVADHGSEKELRMKLQEEVEANARQIKKLKDTQEKMMANGAGAGAGNDDALRQENSKLLKLLRCSCCEQAFKQQVITKCMHTFCKGCLDARIASRQRKCPACGLAFAKEDVQTLYWQ